jgi:hypothetical protein
MLLVKDLCSNLAAMIAAAAAIVLVGVALLTAV